MLLEDRVAFVTGAGSGIGKEIAELFAREGARIAGFDRSGEAADELVAALERAGARSHLFVEGDVRDPVAVERAVQSVVDAAGRIDILVNCAGVREIGDVYTMPAEEWENVIAINLSGTFYCCQSAARQMRETGGGSIVNLSSVGGLIGLSHRPAYTASKHAIVGLTKSLARDLGPAGIRVNALCPGVIRTPMTEQYFSDDTFEQELAVSVPLARYGAAADVARAALFLASDQSGYLSGVALPVDGGFLAEKSFVSGRAVVVPVRERDPRLTPLAPAGDVEDAARAVGRLVAEQPDDCVGDLAASPARPIGSTGSICSIRFGWPPRAWISVSMMPGRTTLTRTPSRPPLSPARGRACRRLPSMRRSRRTRSSRRAGPRPTRRARSSRPARRAWSRAAERPRGSRRSCRAR